MINRILYQNLPNALFQHKAIILYGPRQIGKTTLLTWVQKSSEKKVLLLDGDEPDVRQKLTNVTSTQLKSLTAGYEIVMIDEAQRIENIGITIKLFVDKIKDLQLIATGSSAFELANKISEPLTGRIIEFHLFPVSVAEMVAHHGKLEESRLLENRLIYGMYPEVIMEPGKEVGILKNLAASYLFKDVFNFQEIRRPELVQKLVEALALQVGSEMSFRELGEIVQADPVTVERYIGLLERSYVIFRLRSLSRNVRNELKKSRKIYFYDNGIRNALIANFNPVNIRNDKGALWENYLISERRKYINYQNIYANTFFWRTIQQQEVDYIEDLNGNLSAFEFKTNPVKKVRLSKTFAQSYPQHTFDVISPENYMEFLNPESKHGE